MSADRMREAAYLIECRRDALGYAIAASLTAAADAHETKRCICHKHGEDAICAAAERMAKAILGPK